MTGMTSDSDISVSVTMPTDRADNGGADNGEADATTEPSVVTLTTEAYEQILARIKYLEEHAPQQPTPQQPASIKQRNIRLSKHLYDGVRDDNKILNWLSAMRAQFDVNEMNLGEPLKESDKVIVASASLIGNARQQYDAYVDRLGRFITYDSFALWIKDTFSPSDMVGKAMLDYCTIGQSASETLEQYYIRFINIVSRLKSLPGPAFQAHDFAAGLRREYSELLATYTDMSNYEDITLQVIVDRLYQQMRLRKLVEDPHRLPSAKSLENRISGTAVTTQFQRKKSETSSIAKMPARSTVAKSDTLSDG